MNVDGLQYMSVFDPSQLEPCLHSQVCKLLWGNSLVYLEEKYDTHLIEVISQEPIYLVAVHLEDGAKKDTGVVGMTTKTLKPKCFTCSGRDACIHLTLHLNKYEDNVQKLRRSRRQKDTANPIAHEVIDESIEKDLRNGPKHKTKTGGNSTNVLDPHKFDGEHANVFNISINFIATKDEEKKNLNIQKSSSPFSKKVLIAEYDREEGCEHGEKYQSGCKLSWVESDTVGIHHTTAVNTDNVVCLYRPTVGEKCDCRLPYTGHSDRLLRTSAAGRQNGKHSETLHFVSYEYLFKYLFDLLNGGNFANAYLKSHEQMDEIFFGNKSGMYKKVFHKAFEIFIHALKFPKNAMYCEKCPGELIEGQTEDLFEGEIEVSIIDGVNMGCIQNAAKGFVDQDNFEEEKVDDIVIAGVEKFHLVPEGYQILVKELSLETPVSALLTAYSSNRKLYENS